MTLNERIDRALVRSKDPDPHSIARKLMARMESTERDAALSECLADRVRIQITRARLGSQHASDTHNAGAAGARTEGPSKWQIPGREHVPGVGWKFEVDLTAEELYAIADGYAQRASQMTAKERDYRDRAVKLACSGLETWGEFLARGEQAA